jgi:hypothetical protein
VGSQLQALFQETREAHHEAFDEVDGADPDWPMWYAERMHRRLGTLLRADFTQSELVYLLVLADRERATRAPGAEWTEFYARFFLERYGGA